MKVRCFAFATLAASAACVAPALAGSNATSSATSPKVLGGGFVNSVDKPFKYAQYVRVDRSPGAPSATFTSALTVTCPGLQSAGQPGWVRIDATPQTVALDSAGSFTSVTPVHQVLQGGAVDGAHADGTLTFSGHFASSHSATGAAREQIVLALTNGRTFNCDTRPFAWHANDPFANRVTGSPRARTAYYGRSTDDGPVLLVLSRSARAIANLAVETPLSCASPARTQSFGPVPLRNGAFAFRTTVKVPRSNGQTDSFAYTFTGKVGRRNVLGQMRVKATATRGGRVVGGCSTGTIEWRALSR